MSSETQSGDSSNPRSDIPEYSLEEMNVPDITDAANEMLNPLEREMYEDWRMNLMRWLFNRGKDPEFGEGYPRSSMRQIAYRIEQFVVWVWEEYGYTTTFDMEMADRFWNEELKPNDNSTGTNRKVANAVALVFKRNKEEWSIPNSKAVYRKINKESGAGFTDWFSVDELKDIKNASLRAYAVPSREEMDPVEQEKWGAHLSQRLRKPIGELTEDDWEDANSYRIPSMVYVSCDVGFRPKEIERSRWGWFKLDKGFIKIAKSESTKNSDYWRCYLSDEAVRLMRMWKRESYGDEEPSPQDPVWLTRENNPYNAESLRRPVMQNLMDEAGIDRSEREQGWYMIRRGVGTDIGTRKGLGAVMSQLRITRVSTARRYVRHDERGVREWLNDR